MKTNLWEKYEKEEDRKIVEDFCCEYKTFLSQNKTERECVAFAKQLAEKNGFKALVYMHRYREDTIARMRTDYVHEQQSRYRTAIEEAEHQMLSAKDSERVKITKVLNKLKEQDEELRVYEEKIHHLADQMIRIDLDDGVKNNYELFKDVLAKIK